MAGAGGAHGRRRHVQLPHPGDPRGDPAPVPGPETGPRGEPPPGRRPPPRWDRLGLDVTAPGSSSHDELALLVEAGLTPWGPLRAATRDAATWFGEEGVWGVVAPGARADLLLLAENPLETVSAVEAHVGVLRGDLWRPLARH